MRSHKIISIFLLSLSPYFTLADHNGGVNCAACTLVVSLIDQYSQVLNVPGSQAFTQFCKLQGSVVDLACEALQIIFHNNFDLDKISELRDIYSPDEICLGAGFCVIDEGREACNLFPWQNGPSTKNKIYRIQAMVWTCICIFIFRLVMHMHFAYLIFSC